ncbi:MAG: DNA-3-methyladenine glycosylase 2 family protein [Rhizobiaceae bacterium]
MTQFPKMQPVVEALPEIPLRARAPGFEGLAEIITAQQVSKASAAAIFGRTKAAIHPFSARKFLESGTQPLIEAGQSRAKQVALVGLANAIVNDGLDLEGLCNVSVEQAMAQLTALKGVGPWSAEVFLLFCAGHTDIFPAGDVALQHVVGEICGLESKPDTKLTRSLTAQWAPLRSVAARVFYAHYAHTRRRSAI